MDTDVALKLKPLGFWGSLLFYTFPTIGIFISIKYGIPFFCSIGFLQNVAYMVSMTCTLLPVLIIAIVAFIFEGNTLRLKSILQRFQMIKLHKADWLWIILSFLAITVFSAIFQYLALIITKALGIEYYTIPPEFGFRKILVNEWWIFLIHFFYFFCNIIGEEFLYRGFLLPKQTLKFGKIAWIINGLFWFITHLGVGISVFTMIPLLFIVPFVVQKRKNTTVGIIIHGFVAAMGFYLTAFGIVS